MVRESAAFNLGRLALLIAGLADSRVLISEATEDRLHQDYRSPLFPAAPQLLSGLSRAGALAVCWSGAGPALLGICKGSEGAAVQAATQEVMAETVYQAKVLLLRADLEGLVVDKNGSGDFWKDRKPTWERNQPGAHDSPSGPLDPGVTKGAGVAKGPEPRAAPRTPVASRVTATSCTTSTPTTDRRPGASWAVSRRESLVAVPNPYPGRDDDVRCESPEFTCVCPMTGQPDFATVTIAYVPDQSIVELKSLKLYLWSYRDEGAFHEDVTNRILDDLVSAVAPRRLTVTTDWLVRGGIHTVVEAAYP